MRGAGGKVERLYRYRADNQLAELEERSRHGRRLTSFAYDALGRRTEKRSTVWGPVAANDAPAPAAITTRTDFVWSGNVLLAESLTSSTAADPDTAPADPLATIYLHEPNSFRPLAQVCRIKPTKTVTFYHYQLDHLGTPHELTNDEGRIVWQARLKAWGAVAETLVDEVTQPIRFQGQYHDVETGLHYNRLRYYAPHEECYVHQDPIRLIGGTNNSAYVPSPTIWVDPLGLMPCPTGRGGIDQSAADQVIATPKGARPDPTTYLSSDYINSHLARFQGGVAKIMSAAPTSNVGPPGGTFVMPKAVADELINGAGGSVSRLEQSLSLEPGSLGTNPVRVDIADPQGLRMPSGRELGANGQWIPGGYTAGNIPEATIDPAIPGTYTTSGIF